MNARVNYLVSHASEHTSEELHVRGRNGGLKAAANKRATIREKQERLARELAERAHQANEDICPVD